MTYEFTHRHRAAHGDEPPPTVDDYRFRRAHALPQELE